MFKKAFTLIELLVVIAIIAILAAILFPVFAQAKAAAKQTASLSNVKQLMVSVMMYNGDADDTQMPNIWQNRGDGEWTTWMEVLYPYAKNKDIFMSPGGATDPAAVGVTTCPGGKVVSNFAFINWIEYSYWDWWGTTMFAGFPVEPNASNTAAGGTCNNLPDWASCTGLTHVAEPASTTFLMPGYMIAYPRNASHNNTFGWPCTTGFAPTHGLPDAVDARIQTFRDGGNYGLADGHAKYYSSKRMNGDASRPHNYGGDPYPSSPYMVIVE